MIRFSKIRAITFGAAGEHFSQDAVLDLSGVSLESGERLIRASGVSIDATTGAIYISATMTGTVQYLAYLQATSASAGQSPLGFSMTNILADGFTGKTVENAQFITIVQDGATVLDRAGDAVGGVHVVWAKVQGDAGATWQSGCRVAPFWSDLQINTVDVSGEEVYHFMATAGGSKARALLFMGGTGPAVRFLEYEQALGTGFAKSGSLKDSSDTSIACDGYLVCAIAGVPYYIPLYDTLN